MSRASLERNLLVEVDEHPSFARRVNARENARSYRAVTAFSRGQWYLDTPGKPANSRPSVPIKEVRKTDT
jgi:hypothetical protein